MKRYEKDTLVCIKCEDEKELIEFSYHSTLNKFRYSCIKCTKEYHQKYKKVNKEQVARVKKEGKVWSKYGITLEDRDRMIKNQNNRCGICGIDFGALTSKEIHIDHNHRTNEIRGILCNHCNQGLGQFMENTSTLLLAIEYLEEYNE